MNGVYALALAAGMAATVNPCGFALLPAYLSAFVGLDHRGGRAGAVGRALTVSASLTAGFVLVFGLFGLIVSPLAIRLERYLPDDPWTFVLIATGALTATVVTARLVRRGRERSVPTFDDQTDETLEAKARPANLDDHDRSPAPATSSTRS